MSVGSVIASARLEKGMTQLELSKAAGISNISQFVSNIERGIASVPKKYIYKIATVIGLDPFDLASLIAEEYKAELYDTIRKELKRHGKKT